MFYQVPSRVVTTSYRPDYLTNQGCLTLGDIRKWVGVSSIDKIIKNIGRKLNPFNAKN